MTVSSVKTIYILFYHLHQYGAKLVRHQMEHLVKENCNFLCFQVLWLIHTIRFFQTTNTNLICFFVNYFSQPLFIFVNGNHPHYYFNVIVTDRIEIYLIYHLSVVLVVTIDSSMLSSSISIYFFSIGIHSMQDSTATTRYGVTRKRNTKKFRRTRNLLRKNLQLKDVC